MRLEFEWDTSKAQANLAKHGVAFEEAVSVFADPLAALFADPDHSGEEEREIIVGLSTKPQLLVVSFVEREGRVRLISARRATAAERRRHEEHTQKR
jgi:hypothetical protein